MQFSHDHDLTILSHIGQVPVFPFKEGGWYQSNGNILILGETAILGTQTRAPQVEEAGGAVLLGAECRETLAFTTRLNFSRIRKGSATGHCTHFPFLG